MSPSKRFRVLNRCGFRCVYCGASADEKRLEIDHVIPRAKNGSDDEANLVAACVDCNRGKGASSVAPHTSFLAWLRAQQLRDDWIGDLADDEKRTPLPHDPATYVVLATLLRGYGAERPTLRAAWHAWREWRRGGRPTRATRAANTALRALIRTHAKDARAVWLKRGVWMSGKFYLHDRV